MITFGFKNLTQPTPAKMVKLGVSLVSVSTFIGGYGISQSNPVVSYIGLGIGIIGTFVVNMFHEPSNPTT